MLPTVQMVKGEFTSPLVCRAFGLGIGVEPKEKYISGPWAGMGSPVIWDDMQRAITEGNDYWYIDKPYFNRPVSYTQCNWFRVTKNAKQHTGIGQPDYKRAQEVGVPPPEPWRKGSKIILCVQSEFWHKAHGTSRDDFIKQTVEELERYTDRPIKIRQKNLQTPLSYDLEKAYCVVTLTSNCAVDAVMAGVPVITLKQCAASAMGRGKLSDIENLLYPNKDERYAWASVLVCNQWNMNELRSGECWRAVK